MTLSDLNFIFRFLPVFMIVFAVAGTKLRGVVLLIASMFFYYSGAGVVGLAFLAGSVLLNYVAARLIAGSKGILKKLLLAGTLLIDFGILLFFKYAGLFAAAVSAESRVQEFINSLVMPLGISFYTFTLAAYVIDVYRGTVQAEKNVIRYADHAVMFPKLLSGPIVRYDELKSELYDPRIRRENIEDGFCTFTIGLGMKVLIADALLPVWEQVMSIGYENISTPLAWIGALGFALRLYFDFQGYSLMAMGTGKMIGFRIPLNFDMPYISGSISEFWRRWHITLGAWFKDYVYIPLGGSKKGKLRLVISLTVVWILTGIWHGSTLNFILWGMTILVFILLEKFLLKSFLEKHRVLAHIYVCFIMVQVWVIFAIPDIREIGNYYARLYPFLRKANEFVYRQDYVEVLKSKWPVLAAGIFFCLPYYRNWYEKYKKSPVTVVILLAVFWVSVYMIMRQGSNPFMYCNF